MAPSSSQRKKTHVADFAHVKVLVIDGSRHMRSLVSNVLLAFGIRNVREAGDGSEALKVLDDWHADLLITELNMSPLAGIDMIRMLRHKDPKRRFLPIIVMSGYCEKRHVLAARDAGADEFLAKPLTAAALLQRLEEVVLRRRRFVKTKSFFGPDRRRRPGESLGEKERRAALVAQLPDDQPLTQEQIGLVLDE